MFALLLALIYVAFISLGLPDSLLGCAWPVMYEEFAVPVSFAGIVSTIISAGTIVSSLLSDRLTRKLGAGTVTAVSVLLTAAALLGFSQADTFAVLCVLAIPYGLGAGGVDAALNNYVALHYSSRHMSWLHCFWGLGASISPYIMGWALGTQQGWSRGYGTVSVIQFVLTAILFISLPVWKKHSAASAAAIGDGEMPAAPIGILAAMRIPGAVPMMLAFCGYCCFETTTGLWASTFLVQARGIDIETAANFSSLFFLGITFGRFVSGFVADRMGDRMMIRCGLVGILTGLMLIMLPVGADWPALAGLLIVGIGGAPVYPSIIHATPDNFGRENSQAVIGIQMASAYTGSTLAPPVFGLIAQYLTPALYPYYLALFILLTLVMSERVSHIAARRR